MRHLKVRWQACAARHHAEVEVATAGRYRVEILYTCARDNVGVTIDFTLGDARLSRKVEVAHDPEAYGTANDRVPRVGESAMKDFNTSKGGSTTAYLRDCNSAGNACVSIGSATLTATTWSGG